MRQGQNSKRSRGRGRKPQNSGNRAYDSNGPDVKIRGTATHVCEKYQQLARDAISAGDRVMAENYYQHAEHYYRLLMASQVVTEGQPRPQHNLGYRPDEDQEEDDEEDFGQEQPQPNFPNQPYHQQQSQPYAPRHNNGGNNGRGDRHGFNQGQGQGQNQGQAQGNQSGTESREGGEQTAAGGENSGQGAGQGPDGQRRRQGRRRRQRHDGAPMAGDGRREDSRGGAEASGEVAESTAAASSDEAPAV